MGYFRFKSTIVLNLLYSSSFLATKGRQILSYLRVLNFLEKKPAFNP